MAASVQIVIVIFLWGFTCICAPTLAVKVEPYSTEPKAKQSISFNQPGIASTLKRFEDNAPTLIKLLQVIGEVGLTCLWIVDASLSAFLWLLNETVSSCTEFFIRIFGVLFNVVKLLEALGFGVKFLFELNYAVLSYIFDKFGYIRDSFSHAVTLVKITIANKTENMYESSSMVLEGVQSLFLTACNETWVNLQYASSIVTSNFTAPFGLSALDTSLVASMFAAVVEFFVESVKLTAEIFRDGNIYLFNCAYDTVSRIGSNVLQNFVAFFCFMRDAVTMVTSQIVHMVTWPFYFLASLVSNISCMLYNSLEAFINWVGYLDKTIREIVCSMFRTIWLGMTRIPFSHALLRAYDIISRIGSNVLQSLVAFFCFMRDSVTMVTSQIVHMVTWPFYFLASLVSNISHVLYRSLEAFINWVGYLDVTIREIVYSVFRTIWLGITSLVYGTTGFINTYFPGGILGCIVLACVVIMLFSCRKDIVSLAESSWISVRRMNDNAINIPEDQHQFNNDQDFEFDVQNNPEPPLDGETPQNQAKLKYELELEKDKRLCVICQDNAKNILLLPCRHVCMCLQCLHEVRQERAQLAQCPLCRQNIQSTLEVFV